MPQLLAMEQNVVPPQDWRWADERWMQRQRRRRERFPAEMRPLDAMPGGHNEWAPPPAMRPQDARHYPPAGMRPPDAGHQSAQPTKVPWVLALLGVFLAFIFGAAFGTGGNPHLNTIVSYLRLNVFNRGAAQDLQLWANSAGLPLNIAQQGEFTNIVGTMVALSYAWRRVRGAPAAA